MRPSFAAGAALMAMLLLGACSFFVIPVPIPRGPTTAAPATAATTAAPPAQPTANR